MLSRKVNTTRDSGNVKKSVINRSLSRTVILKNQLRIQLEQETAAEDKTVTETSFFDRLANCFRGAKQV